MIMIHYHNHIKRDRYYNYKDIITLKMLAPNWSRSEHSKMNKRIDEIMTKNRYKIPLISTDPEIVIEVCGEIEYADLVVESEINGKTCETVIATTTPGELIELPDALVGIVPPMRSLKFFPSGKVTMQPRLFVVLYPDPDAPTDAYPTVSYWGRGPLPPNPHPESTHSHCE